MSNVGPLALDCGSYDTLYPAQGATMVKFLFLLNTLLTLPLGIIALASPGVLFAQFGLQLDAAGTLIARGYAATLVGYGLALLLLRNTEDPRTAQVLLWSLVLFNAIESAIQGIAGIQGVAQPIILADAALHGIVSILCVAAALRLKQ
jgi:hypothetical protein